VAHIYQGEAQVSPCRFAIVVSRFNEQVTTRLLDGAHETLAAQGVADHLVDVAWVPGAWEIPLVAETMAATGKYAAVLCLGAVIRGETSHDKQINRAVSLGLNEVSLRHGIPVGFGVLTCENREQAMQRSGGNRGNKGADCALAAIEMVSLLGKLSSGADEQRL